MLSLSGGASNKQTSFQSGTVYFPKGWHPEKTPKKEELCSYLEKTVREMRRYLEKECPELRLANAEASFVTFLDCSAVYEKIEKKVLNDPEHYPIAAGGGILSTFFGIDAGVCMNDGTWFGSGYKKYVRINYGTSRALTMDALKRIIKAVKAL